MYVRVNLKIILFSLIILFSIFVFLNLYHKYNNITFPIEYIISPLLPTNISHTISIISIVDNDNIDNYEVAINTIKCYAAHFNYKYLLLNINRYPNLTKLCHQKDFMYKRHCFLAKYIESNLNEDDIILFIDADIGIINPGHSIEEYIPKDGEEIIFYERIFNHEVMAGSFFIKNSVYTRNFLINWSKYDFKHPDSFDGSDNVGLHYLLLDYIPDVYTKNKLKCHEIWKSAKDWRDCSIFVACTKYIISKACRYNNSIQNETNEYYSLDGDKIKILKKATKRVWVRDVWLTNSLWSLNDFMLHGMKMNKINSWLFGYWYLQLNMKEFNFAHCYSNKYLYNWIHYKRYFTTNEHIKSLLSVYKNQVKKLFYQELSESKIETF
uniref:Nucleotid_trans domain-containing protein n=1 Tax=Parastrongyloides trichosuri TaxID=131310 RepID=A0A0N4ZTZ2_PARTI